MRYFLLSFVRTFLFWRVRVGKGYKVLGNLFLRNFHNDSKFNFHVVQKFIVLAPCVKLPDSGYQSISEMKIPENVNSYNESLPWVYIVNCLNRQFCGNELTVLNMKMNVYEVTW